MFDSIRQQADPVIAVISTLLFLLVLVGIAAPYFASALRSRAPKSSRLPAVAH
jgi:putative spermidine/putrescine transport system permease protein